MNKSDLSVLLRRAGTKSPVETGLYGTVATFMYTGRGFSAACKLLCRQDYGAIAYDTVLSILAEAVPQLEANPDVRARLLISKSQDTKVQYLSPLAPMEHVLRMVERAYELLESTQAHSRADAARVEFLAGRVRRFARENLDCISVQGGYSSRDVIRAGEISRQMGIIAKKLECYSLYCTQARTSPSSLIDIGKSAWRGITGRRRAPASRIVPQIRVRKVA